MDRLDDLEGRIEALADLLLHVTAYLEKDSIIDGPHICADLRHKADKLQGLDPAVLASAQQALCHLADQLDEARSGRKRAWLG